MIAFAQIRQWLVESVRVAAFRAGVLARLAA